MRKPGIAGLPFFYMPGAVVPGMTISLIKFQISTPKSPAFCQFFTLSFDGTIIEYQG